MEPAYGLIWSACPFFLEQLHRMCNDNTSYMPHAYITIQTNLGIRFIPWFAAANFNAWRQAVKAISVSLDVMKYIANGIYGIEGPSEICTQSAEVRLAVSGAQPLFILGLLMFALSLVYSRLPVYAVEPQYLLQDFCQKYTLKNTYKIFKNVMLV